MTDKYVMAAQSASEASDNPTIFLKDETEIVGLFEEVHNDLLPVNGKTESYYGIPYAEAPVGPLRFKPPVPKGKLESPFSALKYGTSCMQPDPEEVGMPLGNNDLSEDCLFLDVLVPHPKPQVPAPVYVFIHGGGFSTGAGNMPHFATFNLQVVYGEIIVVTMNYRLGPFGLLTTGDELIPGNLGLMDQQLALKWVQENIEAFGGDPSRVTVGGISAGSASAGLQVLAPGSRGLFQNVIMQSGSPFDIWNIDRPKEEARADVETLATISQCSEEEIADDGKLLACLQRIPAADILANMAKVPEALGDPGRLPPSPISGGEFLPESPMAIAEKGNLNGENLIVGTNADEGTLFLFFLFPDKNVKPVVNSTMFPVAASILGFSPLDPDLVDVIKTIYAEDPNVLLDETRDDFFDEANKYIGDKVFMCRASMFARMVSESRNVYRYTMTYVPSLDIMDVSWTGAGHGDEVQFFAGTVFQEGYVNRTRDEERHISKMAMNYWRNFIKTGNPNSAEDVDGALPLPMWPKFTKEDQLFKDISPEMKNIYFRQRECYFHDNVLPNLTEAFAELRELQKERDEKSKWTEDGQCTDGSCHTPTTGSAP